MNRKPFHFAGVAVALLLLTACGSAGDILGGGNNNDPIRNDTLRGTVDYVDTANRSITLTNVSGYANMLSNGGGGGTVRVHYDNRTSVEYQGRTYNVADLERGDEVSVRVNESGNSLLAEQVSVLRDSSGDSSYPGGSTSMSSLRGTVRYVDTSRRTIEVDRGYGGSTVIVQYDHQTPVSFNGRNYNVSDLERGDEIEIRTTDLGSGRLRADNIYVTRSVSSGGTSSGNSGIYGNDNRSMSTVRGTVRYHDTARRTIELEQANWISGFQSNGGTYGSTVVISYGSNVGVEIGGQTHAISGLERGDVIEAQVDRSGSTMFAHRIFLVRDARR